MQPLKCSQKATSTVSIVFSVVVEPVGDRLTTNLQRSDGNATEVTTFDPQQAVAQPSTYAGGRTTRSTGCADKLGVITRQHTTELYVKWKLNCRPPQRLSFGIPYLHESEEIDL